MKKWIVFHHRGDIKVASSVGAKLQQRTKPMESKSAAPTELIFPHIGYVTEVSFLQSCVMLNIG